MVIRSASRSTMLPYALVSGVAYLGGATSALSRKTSGLGWTMLCLYAVVLCFFVGFRFEVGKDWFQYVYIFDSIGDLSFPEAINFTDTGYSLLNWAAQNLGFGVSSVFFVCAVILVSGIFVFAVRTSYPWIAVAVAMPHIVTAIAMDHIRQATALGFILIGLAVLDRKRVWIFFACIILGATFHRTAVIFFAFGLVLVSKNRSILYPAFLAIAFVMFHYALSDRLDVYASRYLETEAGSRGALLRLLLNAIPAAGFLLIRDRIDISPKLRKILTITAYAAIACPFLVAVSPSTVVVDRIGKYFLPVQIFFFPAFIGMITGKATRLLVAVFVVIFLVSHQFYWLTQSDLAQDYWIPYKAIKL